MKNTLAKLLKKPHKYRAKAVVIDGIRFASQKEGEAYGKLKILLKAGEIENLRLQPKFLLLDGIKLPDGTKQRPIYYQADFQFTRIVGLNEDYEVVVDVKGVRTEAYKLKAKFFRAHYPKLIFEEW